VARLVDVGNHDRVDRGLSHMPALDDITIPDGKRFVLGAFAMLLLAVIVLPLPEGLIGMMLDCPYL
jgi:hypothetical protein